MPALDRDGDVFVLDLGSDENRFNPGWVGAVADLLDEVAGAPAPRALVTTATGKFWSNGLDLEWMGQNADEVGDFVARVHALFGRVLALPVPAVAAIQGHCFAAGAMLALAHDFRVMRADRGFFCLPEVDIHIPFTPAMAALIQARLSKKTAHEAMTTGRRYGGEEAVAAGIADHAAAEDEVVARAVEIAAALAGKDGATLGAIKERMYPEALALLRDPAPVAFGS
jgi:enoyl-CoA hydratase/carnithine racemase